MAERYPARTAASTDVLRDLADTLADAVVVLREIRDALIGDDDG